MPIAILKKMHVVVAFVSNAETKISGAWHKRLYNLTGCCRSVFKPLGQELTNKLLNSARFVQSSVQCRTRYEELRRHRAKMRHPPVRQAFPNGRLTQCA